MNYNILREGVIIIKAAIYSRKSKFSKKGESVENQVQMCKEYLHRNYNNVEDIKIYEDEDFNGGEFSRATIENYLMELDMETLLKIYKNDKSNMINENDLENEY